jgi:hypothetical protein
MSNNKTSCPLPSAGKKSGLSRWWWSGGGLALLAGALALSAIKVIPENITSLAAIAGMVLLFGGLGFGRGGGGG